jgi:hypothetical protein
MTVLMRMETARRKRRIWFLVIYLTALIVMYVLSMGPAFQAASTGHFSTTAFRRIYLPLIFLGQHTPLRHPLEFWLELWVPPTKLSA